jgi:hypothetical protein
MTNARLEAIGMAVSADTLKRTPRQTDNSRVKYV